mgnify:CR=1 FL=1
MAAYDSDGFEDLLAVAAAREHLGEGGLYAVAAVSGLTDVDAITLSSAQLVRAGQLEKGDIVVLVAFGAGLTWGSTTIRW